MAEKRALFMREHEVRMRGDDGVEFGQGFVVGRLSLQHDCIRCADGRIIQRVLPGDRGIALHTLSIANDHRYPGRKVARRHIVRVDRKRGVDLCQRLLDLLDFDKEDALARRLATRAFSLALTGATGGSGQIESLC